MTKEEKLKEARAALFKCNVDYLFASPTVGQGTERQKCLHIGRMLRKHIDTLIEATG